MTVSLKRTPFSSISALVDWMLIVLGRISLLGPLRSFGASNVELKRVLTSVDLPSPDSPMQQVRSLFLAQLGW